MWNTYRKPDKTKERIWQRFRIEKVKEAVNNFIQKITHKLPINNLFLVVVVDPKKKSMKQSKIRIWKMKKLQDRNRLRKSGETRKEIMERD